MIYVTAKLFPWKWGLIWRNFYFNYKAIIDFPSSKKGLSSNPWQHRFFFFGGGELFGDFFGDFFSNCHRFFNLFAPRFQVSPPFSQLNPLVNFFIYVHVLLCVTLDWKNWRSLTSPPFFESHHASKEGNEGRRGRSREVKVSILKLFSCM